MSITFLIMYLYILKITGADKNEPGSALIAELHNIFDNMSHLALMPELMETEACRQECQIYRNAFDENEIWAAEMFDANGKLSTAILKGNVNQKGHLSQCIHVSSRASKIHGKFCHTNIHLVPKHNDTVTKRLWDKMFHKVAFRSDPYNKWFTVSGQNAIVKELCVPSSCQVSELLIAVKRVVETMNHSRNGMVIHVEEIKEENCLVKEEYLYESQLFYFLKKVLTVMTYLVCAATLIDFCSFPTIQNVLLKRVIEFTRLLSLLKNGRTLFNKESEPNMLVWLNGIRCFAYFWLFLCHFTMRYLVNPFDRSDINEILSGDFFLILGRNGIFAFHLLYFSSSLTTSYKITERLMKNDSKSVFKFILFRYLKVVGFLFVLIRFGTSTVNKHDMSLWLYPPTKNYSLWPIVFCYENLLGLHKMIFPPTHSFYTNMQLCILTCIILIFVKRRENKIRMFLLLILTTLTIRSLEVYFLPNIPAISHFGFTMKEFISGVYLIAATPFGQLPFCISGIAVGYYSRQKNKIFEILSESYRKILGYVIILSFVFMILCLYPLHYEREYNSYDGAVFIFVHDLFAIFNLISIAWYCQSYADSFLATFFGSSVFVVLNRLLPYFAVIHILIVMSDAFEGSVPFQWKLAEMLGFGHLLYTLLVCTYLMLFIHLPLINILRYLFIQKKTSSKM